MPPARSLEAATIGRPGVFLEAFAGGVEAQPASRWNGPEGVIPRGRVQSRHPEERPQRRHPKERSDEGSRALRTNLW